MKRNAESGFTLIELLIVVAIISIIAAIAVPGLLRARMTGNETSAIGSLSAIRSGEVSYSSSCGANSYAGLFTNLAASAAGKNDGFISSDLAVANPVKSGYAFTLAGGAGSVAGPLPDCHGNPTVTAYYATAVPTTIGTSGTRGFAIDAGNAIWQDTSGAAPAQPFASSATVSPIQ